MNAKPNQGIRRSVRVFISQAPALTEWVQNLDQDDLIQELELVEYSLKEGTLIVPPSSFVTLVQGGGLEAKWQKALKSLHPAMPDLGFSEAEMCAIGLVWCELLMDTCTAFNSTAPPLDSLDKTLSSRMRD